ncbi:MAG: hypothetical protein LCH61_04395 [Proteobacteria bacterium]|nr:hypothetical protein [Pseudomonadota bacterium]
MRAILSHSAITVATLLFLTGTGTAQVPAPPVIMIDGPETIVFDSKKDACDGHDVPDVPPRLYRDAEGRIRLFALHYENRALRGDSLDKLKLDCRVVFRGAGKSDPAAYDDKSWIAATWTRDGKTVFGLVHHEYQANSHPGRCSKPDYMSCWYNTILAIRSDNSGDSFAKTPKPVVASAPFPQEVDQGRHRGFFNPTNIVTDGVWHYMIAATTGWIGQPSGACLFRTDNLADSTAWRAYDGTGFTIRYGDPTREKTVPGPACLTLTPFPAPVGSLTRHTPSGQWIAVYQAQKDDRRFPVSGIYAAASKDLKSWSAPRLILPTRTLYDDPCGAGVLNSYPTLIDPQATTRNFEDTGETADLYLSRLRVEGCKHTSDRTLVKVRVRIAVR